MSEINGMIADIQRASVHDGRGFRTTVFFKGCPLKCVWCHNPECISFEKQIMLYPEKCIGCGQCEKGCYSGARVTCGTEMTADEIMEQIRLDLPYYGIDGGVTFSGGEAMAQPELVYELAMRCRREKINTAIETSLYIFREDVFSQLDFVFADLKIWDDKLHIEYTGVSNDRIKKNFRRLDEMNIPFTVRTPLIPGITDTKENILSIRNYVKGFKNIVGYELLPYNPLGNSKRTALGLKRVSFGDENEGVKEALQLYADL